MVLVDIIALILYVFFGLAALIGALVGLKRGLYRSAVKLLANVVSVAVSVWVTSVLADTLITEAFLMINVIPVGVDPTVSIEIVGAIFAVTAFALVFFIVRLLMLIPQHIICRRLPKKYDEAARVDKEANESEEAVSPAYKNPKSGVYPLLKTLWGVFASLIGAVGAMVVIGVYVFPFACFLVHTSEPVADMLDALPETITIGEQKLECDPELKDNYKKVASHPTFLVVDFMYGKTVYRPLLNVTLSAGVGNLDDSVCTLLGVASDILPSALDVMEDKALSSEHITVIKNAVGNISDDKVTVSLAVFGMNAYADSFEKMINEKAADRSQLTKCEEDLFRALEDILRK